MNKKGASHVDWVISMGIFLIYVIALFVSEGCHALGALQRAFTLFSPLKLVINK